MPGPDRREESIVIRVWTEGGELRGRLAATWHELDPAHRGRDALVAAVDALLAELDPATEAET